METPIHCPACNLSLVTNTVTGDLDCIGCSRSWYETEFDGEKTLGARKRKVKLRDPTTWPDPNKEEVRLEDIIRPVDPWVNPPPPANVPEVKASCPPSERSAHVADGLLRLFDGCEVLIQFGSAKDRKSAILLLFHIYREFGLTPRASHADLLDELGTNYGSLPGKPPEDAVARQEFTCNKCAVNLTCPYAWDDYNQGGECLAEK